MTEIQTQAVFTVCSSMPRRVQLGPFVFNLVADDWGTIKAAETAASRAAILLKDGWSPKEAASTLAEMLDALADYVRAELEIEPEAILGCALIAEPI